MKKTQNESTSKASDEELQIVRVPGPYFTPAELDSLADLVAAMIFDHLRETMKNQNQTGAKDDPTRST